MSNLPAQRNTTPAVQRYLDRLAPAAAQKAAAMQAARPRLIFALDATASREPTWDQASQIQGEMFEATAALGGLSIQLVFYRGFDECKASGWLGSAGQLHQAMRRVRCEAGTTQIERILTHALRATAAGKIGALIFVGDAMEESLDPLARFAGQLGESKVPIFTFHEGNDPVAAHAFATLARLSGGACLPFSLGSIDRLKELLGAVAAYAAGGYPALLSYGAGKTAVLQLTSRLKS